MFFNILLGIGWIYEVMFMDEIIKEIGCKYWL